MLQLARLERRVTSTAGASANLTIASGATMEIRRQGATVQGAQSKTTGQSIAVDDIGALKAADTVQVYRSSAVVSSSGGTSTFNVDSVSITSRTVTLSGYTGTLSLSDEDRISPTNALPALYNDSQRVETKTNPLTSSAAGLCTAWLEQGYFDRLITNGANVLLVEDDHVTASYTYNVRDARYGAMGDGTTDDTVAIQRALSECYEDGADGQGGAVELPPGVYMVSSTLTMPGSRVIMRGHGSRTSVLKATAGFSFNGTTDAVVRIGNGANAHSSRLENLTVNCNDVANSIGVYSTNVQETAGVRDCVVTRYRVKGIFFSTTGCQNFRLEGLELFGSVSGGNPVGIHISNAASINLISDVTVNTIDGTTTLTSAGIELDATATTLVRIHVEHHATGVQCDTNATGAIIGIYGHSSVTDLVQINFPGWLVLDANKAGGTNTINDTATGGAGTFSQNSGGWYFHSNDGGAGEKAIFSSDADAPSRMVSAVKFVNTATTKNMTNAASADPLVIGTGNFFNVTGTNNFTNITTAATDNGRIIVLKFAGILTITDGGNLILAGNYTTSADDTLTLVCNGTNWYEMCRSVN